MNISTICLIISLVLTAIAALDIFFKVLNGMKKGAYLQPVQLLLVVISAVLSFLFVTLVSGAVFESLEGKTMEDLVNIINSDLGLALDKSTTDMLLAFDARIVSYILAIPVAILAPILFLLFYFAIKVILYTIFKIVNKFTKIPVRTDLIGKIIGGVLGAVEGVLVIIICFVPMSSILNIVVPMSPIVESTSPEVAEIIESTNTLTESPIMTVTGFLGGDFLANELTTVSVNGDKVNVTKELAHGVELFTDVLKLAENDGNGNMEFALTPEKEAIFDSMLVTLEKSELMTMLISGAMHLISDVVFKDIPEPAESAEDKLMAALKDLLHSGNETTVISDLRTMKELIFFLEREEVIDAFASGDEEATKNILSKKDENGNTIIKAAINILKSNHRTNNIISVLNEISVAILCESMGNGANSAEVYENVKDGLNDLITIDPSLPEEEYKENVKTTLSTTLENNGIVLEEEIVNTMTDYVTDYLDDSRENGTLPEEIGDEEFADIILTYYDAYLEYQQSGVIPDGFNP